MPGFYALILYVSGIFLGFALPLDLKWQTLIILILFISLARTLKYGCLATRLILALMMFCTGVIRVNYSSVDIPYDDFFLACQNIIGPLRDNLVEGMGYGLADKQRELIAGIILGRGSGMIVIKEWTHFVKSGMSHLLVASGAQVSLTVFPVILLAENTRLVLKLRNFLLILAGVLLFVLLLLVGQEPSILRAVTAGYLYLAARLINRKANSLNIIYVTALFWLLVDPKLIYNIGFRLSYAASWGLIYLYPRLSVIFAAPKPVLRLIKRNRHAGSILIYFHEVFLLCIAAQISVIPILAFHFHKISITGLISNIIAVPVAGLTTYLGLSSSITYWIFKPLAGILNLGNGFLLFFLDSLARRFSDVPYIYAEKVHWMGLILPYFFMWLFIEARFKPHSLIILFQTAYRFTHPIEELRDVLRIQSDD